MPNYANSFREEQENALMEKYQTVASVEKSLESFKVKPTQSIFEKNTCNVDVREPSLINWEQRRYEIAKAMYPVIYENYPSNDMAKTAVQFADKLIEELKKE